MQHTNKGQFSAEVIWFEFIFLLLYGRHTTIKYIFIGLFLIRLYARHNILWALPVENIHRRYTDPQSIRNFLLLSGWPVGTTRPVVGNAKTRKTLS